MAKCSSYGSEHTGRILLRAAAMLHRLHCLLKAVAGRWRSRLKPGVLQATTITPELLPNETDKVAGIHRYQQRPEAAEFMGTAAGVRFVLPTTADDPRG